MTPKACKYVGQKMQNIFSCKHENIRNSMEFPRLWKYFRSFTVYDTVSLLKSELRLHHKNEVRKKHIIVSWVSSYVPKGGHTAAWSILQCTCMNAHIKAKQDTKLTPNIQTQQKYRIGTLSNIKHVSFDFIRQRDIEHWKIHIYAKLWKNYTLVYSSRYSISESLWERSFNFIGMWAWYERAGYVKPITL